RKRSHGASVRLEANATLRIPMQPVRRTHRGHTEDVGSSLLALPEVRRDGPQADVASGHAVQWLGVLQDRLRELISEAKERQAGRIQKRTQKRIQKRIEKRGEVLGQVTAYGQGPATEEARRLGPGGGLSLALRGDRHRQDPA